SPDRATSSDRRSPVIATAEETYGREKWHGQETVPQRGQSGRRQIRIGCTVIISFCLLVMAGVGSWLITHSFEQIEPQEKRGEVTLDSGRFRYRGQVNVLVERPNQDGKPRPLRLDKPGALPLKKTDKFRI